MRVCIFLSTPSARRATHELDHGQRAQVISIHALCEEGDVDRADVPEGVVISIHALCEEGDGASCPSMVRKANFYPRPLRGGRPRYAVEHGAAEDISIHALREEGDSRRCRCCRSRPISIHALREEGDPRSSRKESQNTISIHALREEGDS